MKATTTIGRKDGKDIGWDDYMTSDEAGLFTTRADDLFHVGESVGYPACETFVCKLCGGNEFNAGRIGYTTAIRCVKCEWEWVVHEG